MVINFHKLRKGQNQNGGRKFVYIRKGIITKWLINLEGNNSETIYLEITLPKKKCCIVFAYRSPQNNNKNTGFSPVL